MRTTRLTAGLLATTVALLAAACGGSNASDDARTVLATTTTTATEGTTGPVERPTSPVDQLIAVDGGRMHLRCVGSGPTTVLLIAGWGDGGETWGSIEPAVAERARVCSYARFGTGTSDPQTATQTFATRATDLHALMEAAGEPGPYVVVGHSFGGAEAVTFAAQHADEVVGLMLLDASPVTWPETACSVVDDGSEAARNLRQGCTVMHDPTLDPERLDAFAAFREVGAITSLGDLPMTVMSAAERTLPGLSQDERDRLSAVWDDGVAQWAALSTSSSVVTVQDTGHHIQLDQPDLVIEQLVALLPGHASS